MYIAITNLTGKQKGEPTKARHEFVHIMYVRVWLWGFVPVVIILHLKCRRSYQFQKGSTVRVPMC